MEASAKRVDEVLNDVEKVMGKMEPEDMALLASKLNGLKVADEVSGIWDDEVKRLVGAGKMRDGDVKILSP